MESSCEFHGYSCGFSDITRSPNLGDRKFQPEVSFDEEQVLDLRRSIFSLPGVTARVLLSGVSLYHSSSSSKPWWEKSLPESQSAGGVFFSTVPQLSIYGGKAPLGVTLEYKTIKNNMALLYLPDRSLLKPLLLELSGEEELANGHDLVGDDIIPLLNQLGFWGYYSCDECEIFLANETIPHVIGDHIIWEDRRLGRSYTIR